MRFHLSPVAEEELVALSSPLLKLAYKQFEFLVADLRHPSLRAKKYDEATGLWQARISRNWRFYFFIIRDVYFIVSIKKHPK